ncbi:HlyD family efflux transporter periplasmic adaptor subunit [Paraburkholderia sp. MMS20-SJTN17]|uniref:HlyD family efflux transporter periplasmic adaptor subunit n=1 Tax=Paraburkholderia translucens TaxID=2886945 RepID=A0ABS8KHA4_9BURK|nr:HlyD family efflux transporter periplasmic adaptor subunit [Paraburkholderia sp. MMS20-SJTN17]MCC8404120.1 HlyD family efflux transporter periplasmic adaptor subunit [Paraburkholderia sp. MMS20-SJTN17]
MSTENLLGDHAAVTKRDASKITRRNRMLAVLFGVAAAVAIAAAVHWLIFGRYAEETDNAYVAGNVVPIAAQVAGTARAVLAGNTQYVKAGQPLVQLDDTEARIALGQAEAQLIRAVRQARSARISNAMYQAAVKARAAELALAEQALKARSDATVEVVSGEEYARARESVEVAQANLAAARSQLASGLAASGSGHIENDPAVMQAIQQLKLAYVRVARTTIVAPLEGAVAQRSVQIGQPVPAGAQLMTVVPVKQLWIEANFKEGQIRNLRIGQPVSVVSDLYGAGMVFHGRIGGLSPGTGSAFSMLPPQNAAGNWIKVVQRVPVVVSLDPAELAAHPLRVGLSMTVSVDTHQRDGTLNTAVDPAGGSASPAPDEDMQRAESLARRLIEEND